MTYIKYKTTLCRHFEEYQTCSLMDACSFAHGEHERRGINDVSGADFFSIRSFCLTRIK